MKKIFTLYALSLIVVVTKAQNTDLPTPTANLQTLPAGSYIIAMDNTNQVNNAGVFNYAAYGLIVHLLNNNVKVKWVITAGKAKDATDISVNAARLKPTAGSAANLNFKAGPFVIFANDTTGVAALIDGFNAGISNANDKIKVYKTNATVTADIRYNLSGFKPKGAILTDGGNEAIHLAYFTKCKIPASNYTTASGTELTTKCFTFASEPHNKKTGSVVDATITAIKQFVQAGGNFLAQCEAVNTYENNPLGRFQTTTGITDANSNAGTAISYPNPDLSFSQFEGSYNISKGGSLQNWRINAAGANNFHKHANASSDASIIGASVSKHKSGSGGMVFYIGNHQFDDDLNTLSSVNGLRMYMNAFLTPTSINNNCNTGEIVNAPLPVHLISFQGNLNKNNKVTLTWTVAENETTDHFEVERSINGKEFTTAALVFATDKSGNENYIYAETINSNDKVMFRLKMFDKQQDIDYSKILVFQTRSISTNELKIYGNPVREKITFSYTTSGSQLTEVKIYDVAGKVMMSQKINSPEGTNMMSLPLSETLKPGMYVVEVSNGADRQIAKFIKQ
jgi:hypothetical protein